MNIEKLKAAAIAANQAWMDEPYEIEPALVLELIERLEAAEKQRDELLSAVEPFGAIDLVESRLPAEFAMLVLRARAAIASVKEKT